MEELPIIQKTYDLIKWYVPILYRLPKTHKFTLGNRMINQLYDIMSCQSPIIKIVCIAILNDS